MEMGVLIQLEKRERRFLYPINLEKGHHFVILVLVYGLLFVGCHTKDQNGQNDFSEYYVIHPITKDSILARSKLNSLEVCQVVIKDGLKNGKFSCTYPNGKLQAEGYYQDGKKSNKWSFYYKDGSIQKEGTYWNDKEDGKWISYYQNGQTEFNVTFLDGSIILDQTEFDSLGNPTRYRFKDYDGYDLYVIDYYKDGSRRIIGKVPFFATVLDSIPKPQERITVVGYLGIPPSLVSFKIQKVVVIDAETSTPLGELTIKQLADEHAEWANDHASQVVFEEEGIYDLLYHIQILDSSKRKLDTVVYTFRIPIRYQK